MYTTLAEKKKDFIANQLVPFIQDVDKWKAHYKQKARSQVHSDEMMKDIQKCNIRPRVVSESVQLIEQARADLEKEKQVIHEKHVPIKATPEFTKHQSTQKQKRKSTSQSPLENKSSKSKAKKTKSCPNDIFN